MYQPEIVLVRNSNLGGCPQRAYFSISGNPKARVYQLSGGNMKNLLSLFAAVSLVAYGGAISTTAQLAGTTVNGIDITGFATTGSQMGGMTITGVFATGSSAVCTWVNGVGFAGGCTSAGGGANSFQLGLDGDTFDTNFLLTSILGANLLSLDFDGIPGFTVFDRTFANAGTDGSAFGADASGTTSPANVNGSATYRDLVGTQGNLPVGDLFARVFIEFSNGGLAAGSTASWRMDTDNLGIRGGTPGSGVPEPSTFGMIGLGLAGLMFFRRSRA